MGNDQVAISRREFEYGLEKVKAELIANLQGIDPLDKASLENFLSLFNQRLIIFQLDFLNYLSRVGGAESLEVEKFSMTSPSADRIPEIASAILAGGAGALLVSLIPVGTTGFWIWKKTVTAAASMGAALGLPAGAVTVGVGILVGAVAGVVTATLLKSKRREVFRKVIVNKFDEEIAPRLRKWANIQINKCLGKR